MDALRKIVIVGMSFEAPEGAPLLYPDGSPIRASQAPVRLRVVFWVPQREPFKRRPVQPLAAYLASLPLPPELSPGAAVLSGAGAGAMTAEQYRREHLVNMTSAPRGYTMVADATVLELNALRDGVIVEQVQDFTFPRMPTPAEQLHHLQPHWEQRTLAATGHVPNGGVGAAKRELRVEFARVQ